MRQRLGSYSEKDYEIWKRRAAAGEFGNYTIEQLNTQTNREFDRLFPKQRRGNEKPDPKTLGQIWYAIAAERVSKLESAN